MRNTSEYCWADISIMMLGKKVAGARAIKYNTEQEKEAFYAAGNKPVGMGRGNKKYTAEIKVLLSELNAVIKSAGGDPTDLPPFDVVNAFIPKQGMPITTDVIIDAEFVGLEKALNQGDKFAEVTLPLACLDINYDI